MELIGSMLQRWAAKKHSNINPLFFTQLFERQPAVAWALAPAVAAHAQSAPTEFHRTTCFEMLLALARQSGLLKQDPSLLKQARRVAEALPAALQAAVELAQAGDTSKKTTKMLQGALAVALKFVDLEQQYKLGLDQSKLRVLAAQVEASATATRAKSVQQAALRLRQRAGGEGGKGGKGGAGKSRAAAGAEAEERGAKPVAKKRKTRP